MGHGAPVSEEHPPGEHVLQAESGRRVVREAGGRTVRKTFSTGPAAQRERTAADELSRLARFAAALADVPGASCPRPLGAVGGREPGYRMSWVEGEGLVLHLARRALREEDLARWGRTIAAALRAYVASVGEPYEDLKLDNILVAPDGTLAFVDMGLPQGRRPEARVGSPFEVSVGNLLASVVFESARPRWLLRRRLHRQSVAVAAAVVTALAEHGQPLRGDLVADAARGAYLRSTFDRGSWVRSIWYGTVGRAVGRRVRTNGAVIGPVGWRSARALSGRLERSRQRLPSSRGDEDPGGAL